MNIENMDVWKSRIFEIPVFDIHYAEVNIENMDLGTDHYYLSGGISSFLRSEAL